MARFKIDENLPTEVVELLRSAGHDVTTVVDEGLLGSPDEVVAREAHGEERAILTLDADLADIRRFPPRSHSGVVFLRVDDQRVPAILEVCKRMLPIFATESMARRLYVVTESRVRVREGN
jgi:predicted nuclease of predicted toxin-antitoxin system